MLEISMAENGIQKQGSRKWKKWVCGFGERVKEWPRLAWRTMWRVGKDDPRRAIHSVKVGGALTLVSLLYLMEPLFKGVGQNAMWAVMTVVVVMEFTVGATLCKGLNRGLGTILAGSLAFLVEYVVDSSDRVFKAVFIGAAVFLLGAATTYVRFIPYIKKNYDYGVLIFLLTFNLITVSSYRIENVLKIAKDRISTIAIGCGLCLIMSLLVFPNWSGEDLHNSTISKLEGLARSIEACVKEYFSETEKEAIEEEEEDVDEACEEDLIYKGYKAVLDSKAIDETLALQASWEPRCARYCHRIPWQQYAKVGASLRHFSYTVVALHGCLQSEIQTPRCLRVLYKDSCIRLGEEVAKVLRDLAKSIKNYRHFSRDRLCNTLHQDLQDLNSALQSQPHLFLGSRNGRTTPIDTPKHREQEEKQVSEKNKVMRPQLSKTAMCNLDNPKHTEQEEKEEEGQVGVKSIKVLRPQLSKISMSSCDTPRHNEQEEKGEVGVKKKVLRPQLSKIAMRSLELSQVLPFAAFTSLLVEMVAKLDHVMDEVEELGRLGHFKEFSDDDDDDEKEVVVKCERPPVDVANNYVSSNQGTE